MHFSFLVQEGRAGQPRMMSVGLHCRLARAGRVSGLSDFIDYAKSFGREVWITTREEVADFWYENHYPKGLGSPVQDPKAVTEEKQEEEDDKAKEDDLVVEEIEGDII